MHPSSSPINWSDQLRGTLAAYEESLLRAVASRLVKPRNQWPIEELVDRSIDIATNPAGIDRRLKELEPASLQVLALIASSRQPQWTLGNLIEMLMALGHEDGLRPVMSLLEAGLLFPRLGSEVRLKTFEQWLANPGPLGLLLFTHPIIAERAQGESLPLPDLSQPQPSTDSDSSEPEQLGDLKAVGPALESDGLEWLLRVSVLWQQAHANPFRRTQQGDFFKRDLERLQSDPLLTSLPNDKLVDIPDLGLLVAALAEKQGLIHEVEGELQACLLPSDTNIGLWTLLEGFWSELWRLQRWNPLEGWRGDTLSGNPFASAYLLTFHLLARLPDGNWMRPEILQKWLLRNHPWWSGEKLRPSQLKPWLETFLLGLAYHLRLVQVGRTIDGTALVRLTAPARWLLLGGSPPDTPPVFAQTLLIQPNLEIVAFRQGLTPALILKLTRFAAWKSLGAACTLQLEPETIYRALESGQSFESIRLTLEQHGTRAVPTAVLEALRTWANKRDRITVYPAGTLLEFGSAEDLTEALARGLPGVRLSDTLAVVASEDEIDFKHYRLTGTRDYALPPERCIRLDEDGVTLTVDTTRSDLLIETELPRFAELIANHPNKNQKVYRLTPASLTAGRESGLTLTTLENWFVQRCGEQISAAARLLMGGSQLPPPRLQRLLVLDMANEELADGLVQWADTRDLFASRLGPTALAVKEEQLPILRDRLRLAGLPAPEGNP